MRKPGAVALSRLLTALFGICAILAVWMVSAVLAPGADAAGTDAILIDGTAASGETAISQGSHTITVQTSGGAADLVWIAVYENSRFRTVSPSSTLAYDFPESGAEIVLFLLNSQLRPLRREVRVRQAGTGKLAYTGQAVCYDELFDEQYDEYEDFNSYTVQVQVVTDSGRITEIRDITGYDSPGKKTNAVNASFLAQTFSEALPSGALLASVTFTFTSASPALMVYSPADRKSVV